MFFRKKHNEITTGSVMPDKKLGISSVDLRNGQQSLFATRFKTADMLPIISRMDQVGFEHIEVWGGATFDVCIRYLGDDPWERLRLFKQYMPNTPTRMLLRGQNLVGYRQYPDDVVERFVYAAANCGMDVFLVFDGLNDVRNCETAIRAAKAAGKSAQGAILYTVSPVHDLQHYIKTAQDFADCQVDAIHLIDMAGLLKPEEAGVLVRTLKEKIDLPLHIKCHCTSGLAEMSTWEAIKAGVDAVSTCFSSLSGGTSNPCTEAFVAALQGTGRDTGLDLELLQEINAYFVEMSKKYQEFHSSFTGVDVEVLKHQIPGGMISNLESQLKGMGALNRIQEVFAEAQIVRKDLGYPPLATPFSQMVGAQSTVNVLTGQRYKMISTEVKNYVRGMYGHTPGPIAPELREAVLGTAEPIQVRPGSLLEPEFEKRKAECLPFARSEEDILTYALFPDVGEKFLKAKYGL